MQVTLSDGINNSIYTKTITLARPVIPTEPINVTPILDTSKEVKTLVIKYFPLDSSGTKLDQNITSINMSLSEARAKTDSLTIIATAFLTKASQYHGYKTNSPPALNYKVIDSKEFLKPQPAAEKPVRDEKTVRTDYITMLSSNVDVCDYVNNKGVSQVWIWGYHTNENEIHESNMSMGRETARRYGLGDYGDVSNSRRTNDLPVCEKTYVVYHYNYQRSIGELLEDHGHQIEAVLRWADYDLFWDKFVNPHGGTDAINNCGWIHSPPNVTDDNQYDWANERTVKSSCEDWKPDGTGEIKDTNCHSWYQYRTGTICPKDASGFATDGGFGYKIWWMQNLPGMNNGLTYQGWPLRNWWEFIGDFDNAIANVMASGVLSLTVRPPSSVMRIQSIDTRNRDINYVPPASLPHPSYLPTDNAPGISLDETYNAILRCFNVRVADDPSCSEADLTGDGVVDIFDYNIFVENFGKKTTP